MRPRLVFMCALILSVSAVTWSIGAEKVNVATPTRGLVELPVVVAMRNGYFHSEGLTIQKIQIEPEVAVRALAGGEVDFNLAWDASVRAALNSAQVKLVSAVVSRPLQVLISRPEIRNRTDLAGKILGIDAHSSMTDFATRIAARYLGLVPGKQVGIVEIGGSALRLAALRAGEIHATTVDLAAAVKAEDEGFRNVVYTADIIDLPISGVFVSSAKLAKQRDQVKRFVRATLRGARFIKHERADAVRIIQHYLKLTPSQAEKSYDRAVHAFTQDGLVSDRVLALSARRVDETLPSVDDRWLNQVADWSLVREILADRRKVPFWLRLKEYDF